MKKRIVGIVLILCLVCSLSATACAETITLGTVWFKSDGSAMDNDFQKNLTDNNVESELKNRMRELQPGDDVTFVINPERIQQVNQLVHDQQDCRFTGRGIRKKRCV